MNCQDVREGIAAPARGGAGLTEWALAHAHVTQCPHCQAERASLHLVVTSVPAVEAPRGSAGAHLIEQLRVVVTRVAPSLIWLRSTSLSVLHEVVRAARATAATEATRLGDLSSRIRVLVSHSLTASARAAGEAIEMASASLTRAASLLPTLFVPSARVAAVSIGRVRSVSARVPRLLTRVGSASMIASRGIAHAASLLPALFVPSARVAADSIGSVSMTAFQGIARASSEAGGAVLGSMSRSFAVTLGAAGRGIMAGRGGVIRAGHVLVRAGGQLPSLLAPPARAVGHILGTIPDRARAHPRAWAGMAALLVLGAPVMVLGPRQWPDLVSWFSPAAPPVRDVRLPVDVDPGEPSAATPLARVEPRVAPAPQPVPQPVQTPRVAAPETRAAIPAPVRRAPASAPAPSTDVTSNGESSDPAAAIDWLLKGSGRRNAQSP